MDRTSTSKDYEGRLVDLSIFPDLSTSGSSSLMYIGDKSKMIAGASKACQKFLIVFLTKLGSDKSRPNMGTAFSQMIQSGSIFISPGQVEQAFNVEALAAIKYIESISNYEYSSVPLDEIITEVRLTDFTISKTRLSIKAIVKFADNSTLSMMIPIA